MKTIKLFDPYIGIDEEKALVHTLKSKFWASGAGTGNVERFEKKFLQYTKSKECIAVNNGTSALHLALSLLEVKGKEVIVPSMSFVSTANAVLYNGGTPIFADIDPDKLCIDPDNIRRLITKKTVAVLPVHFGGMSCDLNKISEICRKYDLTLIEDAAHAAGTTYKKKRIGGHGTAVCFSFHPVKNLAMPTGGAITLNDKHSSKNAIILKTRRWCGISNRRGAVYDVSELGWNFYMNEFSAAVGLVQLSKLDSMNNKRKKIAKRYFDEIRLFEKMPYDLECSYHFYWIQVKNRSRFMSYMEKNNVQTGIHYLPIHKMSLYNSAKRLPITENISRNIVSIPIHPNLTEMDVNKIIDLVNKFS
jgi:dTDP-4-amino-4,6-dideoxygalactose transaminase